MHCGGAVETFDRGDHHARARIDTLLLAILGPWVAYNLIEWNRQQMVRGCCPQPRRVVSLLAVGLGELCFFGPRVLKWF